MSSVVKANIKLVSDLFNLLQAFLTDTEEHFSVSVENVTLNARSVNDRAEIEYTSVDIF